MREITLLPGETITVGSTIVKCAAQAQEPKPLLAAPTLSYMNSLVIDPVYGVPKHISAGMHW